LRGRAGRQGDPGFSRFFVSLEDDLMRLFASDRMAGLMARGFEEGEAMHHPIATRAIASAQKKIEGINFDQRKHTLDYDNVMNKQRVAIYGFRRQALLAQDDNRDQILDLTGETLANEWETFCPGEDPEKWNIEGFREWVRRSVPFLEVEGLPDPRTAGAQPYLEELLERCQQAYDKKSEVLGPEVMSLISRMVILQIVDTQWRDHLLAIDELRKGIGLQGYGQKDPLVEYQREATEMFLDMMDSIYKEIFERIYRATIVQQEPVREVEPERVSYKKEEGRQSIREAVQSAHAAQAPQPENVQAVHGEGGGEEGMHRPTTYRRTQPKVGPNDPCPCGSGKKYKKCHGVAVSRGSLGMMSTHDDQ
jgi:preprotein translocase subunit SecA